MDTIFDQIVDAFKTVLSAATAVSADIEVDQLDEDPVPEASADAVRITLDTSIPQQLGGINGNPVDWETVVIVTCLARLAGASARPAANTLAKNAYAKLAADQSLGLSAAGVYIGEPSIDWATDRSATRNARATLTYRVSHRTSGLAIT